MIPDWYSRVNDWHPMDEPDQRPDEEIRKENSGLRAQVMNLMGKLEVRENFVPRVIVDLASMRKLIVTSDDSGCVARIKLSHWERES